MLVGLDQRVQVHRAAAAKNQEPHDELGDDIQGNCNLRTIQFLADYESIVFALEFGVSAFAFIAELTFLGLDSIPDSYTNPNQGTNKSIDSSEVGSYGDLVRRRKLDGQGSQFDIHHVPQQGRRTMNY